VQRLLLSSRFRKRLSAADLLVLALLFGLLWALLDLGRGMISSFSPLQPSIIHMNPLWLPYYAGRSLLRMFIAYFLSLAFTLVYGRYAAYHKTAEKIMIPALDILQSVPVLGFLSVTVTGFLALFPGSMLGPECASIFAIFTAQAWNMTFSFYHSLTTLPKELQEAADVYRLRRFARFTRLEVPFAMIGLVWNSMMSFGGSWFFLTASEMITVLHNNIELPGIGSYIGVAIQRGDGLAIAYGIIAMVLVIVLVDQFVWRPIVAWSQRFTLEQSGDGSAPDSWFLRLLRRSNWVQASSRGVQHLFAIASDGMRQRRRRDKRPAPRQRPWLRPVAILALCAAGAFILRFTVAAGQEVATLGWSALLHVVVLGFYTFLRVLASTLLGAIWTVPVGVAIGMSKPLARIAQPLVQIAASFPSNVLFPLVTILYLRYAVNFQIGSIPLMMLGTQWYILFNVIAGASAIPTELKEATSVLGLRSWSRWKTLILPAIFPSLVTGGITASGGAWNASILAEIVTWKHTTLTATGLGAYITTATTDGNWAQITWGILVMVLFVVALNRLLWRPLYRLAETKFHLE
jgi:NitT/TauT family transport system permease protein